MLRHVHGSRLATLGFLSLTLSMCTTGTETDNPLVEFDASPCKGGGHALTLASDVMRSEPGLTLDPEQYEGLHCFAWEVTSEGALTIDVLNYSAGCSIEWEPGDVSIDGDKLAITARNGICAVAGCGSCIYDFSFEVNGVDTSRPVALTFQEDDCHSIETAAELTLPLDESSEGIVCREVRLYAGLEPVCGGPHTSPCTSEQGVPDCASSTCDGTLRCVANANEDSYDLCLEECESDDDCSLDVDSCQDGLCRLRETF